MSRTRKVPTEAGIIRGHLIGIIAGNTLGLVTIVLLKRHVPFFKEPEENPLKAMERILDKLPKTEDAMPPRPSRTAPQGPPPASGAGAGFGGHSSDI